MGFCRTTLRLLPAALIIFGAAFSISAQSKTNERRPQTQPPPQPLVAPASSNETTRLPDNVHYSYEFSQPQFYVRHIIIEHDSSGRGRITFQRQNEETFEESIEFSPAALGRVRGLWSELQFLDSNENYQTEKQFPHLGTMRLGMNDGRRKRSAEFNWTHNKQAFELANEYRRLADQTILVFDIGVSRENQPLNSPKLMDLFEILLNRNGLSDPQQLVPLLREVSTDYHLPLIARNHAIRLLTRLAK